MKSTAIFYLLIIVAVAVILNSFSGVQALDLIDAMLSPQAQDLAQSISSAGLGL